MEQDWHLKSVQETFAALNTSRHGLSEQEALARLKKFGFNQLVTFKGPSLWSLFFHQFLNPLIFILFIAAGVKFFTSGYVDGAVLLVTVFLMVLIGFFQEVKAEKAMRALKQLSAHKSKVKRDGKLQVLPSEALVPGDEIILDMGDKIPADARLIEAKNLKVDESMMSGESMPSEKNPQTLQGTHSLADRKNMLYTGTVVAYGKGTAIVVSTGMKTELGKIALSIQEIKSEPTPLQKSIQSIGNWMLVIILCVVVFFVIVSLFRGMNWSDIFLLGVAAAVSAIPEGLPAAFTITLAAGVNVMIKRNAIIRKLITVETLGAATTICTDKTGTLTQNLMTATHLYTFEKSIQLQRDEHVPLDNPIFKRMLEIGTLCNDALLSGEDEEYDFIGDPTEGALLVTATKAGLDQESLSISFPRIAEIPFISENLYMATLHSGRNSKWIYVKGAPEQLLAMSTSVFTEKGEIPLDEKVREQIQSSIDSWTTKALRLLAVAYREVSSPVGVLAEEAFDGKLTFVGIFGMIDPPRKEVLEAIETCKKAGIRVAMITGDNQLTAEAIAAELGISTKGSITGNELQSLSNEQLGEKVKETSVFARVEPSHKLRIVRAFQASGQIVAMTGDGVNDAPALEAANIGVSMGLAGTDVAKEAADMILADDRFDSIVAAVEEGRAIFNRLRSICTFLLTTCFGELFGLIITVSFTGLAPLLPLQILWINLISGSAIAIPLGLEPKSGKEMQQPPRDPKLRLLYVGMIYRIIYMATLLGIGAFGIFYISYPAFPMEKARTMVLTSIVAFEWLIALKMRSDEIPLHKIGLFKNPVLIYCITGALLLHLCILYIPLLQKLFHTEPLSLSQWGLAIVPGLIIFILESLRKEFLPTLFNKGKWKP